MTAPAETVSLVRSPRYHVVDELGRGGMGVVYRAYDRELDMLVALKTVPRWSAADVILLKREFRTLLDLHHPNLIQLLDLVTNEGECFFTMELLHGVDLVTHARHLSSGDALTSAVLQLLDGVEALHGAGIVHRDIKPSNVMVTSSGRVVLLDFGLAGLLRPDGRPGQGDADAFVGTLVYMAPEQITTAAVGPEADLYAIGAVLHEALTGAPPFAGEPAAIVAEKWSRAPRPLAEGAPPASRGLCEVCARLLSIDARARPTAAEVRALLERTHRPRRPAIGARPRRGVFVGRDRELAALAAAFGRLDPERPPLVVEVHGESGVGKSALLERFCDDVSQREDTVVLAGRCHPNEAVPYNAFDAIADRLASLVSELPPAARAELPAADTAALMRLFPVFAPEDQLGAPQGDGVGPSLAEVRQRAIAALLALLAGLSRGCRLVLWIDDVQWSDGDSAVLVRELLARTSPAALLVLLSYRAHEGGASALVSDLRRLGAERPDLLRREELQVAPLGMPDAEKLLRAALVGASTQGIDLAAALDQAAGAPFFLWEIAEVLRDRTEEPEAVPWARKGGLGEVVRYRLGRFPEGARSLVEIVSLAGGPVPREATVMAAGVPAGAALLSALCRAKLLRHATTSPPSVQVFHDRIGDAALEGLGPERRRALHGRLADALEATGCTDLGRLVAHNADAGRSERAAGYARRAADEALAALAFDRASRFYQMSLDLAPRAPAEDAAIHAALGQAHAAAGRTTTAASCLLQAAERSGPREALGHRRLAAELLIGAGHLAHGKEVLAGLLCDLGMSLPSRSFTALAAAAYWRARLALRGLDFSEGCGRASPEELARIDVCWTVSGSMGFFDAVSAFGFQTRHLISSLDAGDPSRIARALAMELVYVDTTGRDPRRVRELEGRLAALLPRIDGADERAFILLSRGFRLLHAGRFREALEHLDAAEAIYASLRTSRWERNLCRTHRVFALVLWGRIEEAGRAEERLSAELRAEDDLSSASNLDLIAGCASELRADRPDGAQQRVHAALAPWADSLPLSFEFLAVMAEVRIALYRGDGRGARARLEGAWRRLRPIHAYQSERIVLNWLRGLAALSAGGAEHAAVAREASRIVAREDMPWARGHVATLEAGLALTEGDRRSAVRSLERAEAAFTAAEMTLDAAAVAWWRASLHGENPGSSEAAMRALGIASPARWARLHAPVDLR